MDKNKQNQQILTDTNSIAYRNFVNTCKSAKTRKNYEHSLQYYISYLCLELDKLKEESIYDYLIRQDPKITQMNICDFITYLSKQKKLASKSIAAYVAAIRKFYEMNDMTSLNWKKIHSFEQESEKRAEDVPYTSQQLKIILDKATPRNRAIILTLSSSGCRVGAAAELRMKDLTPIDKYGIYKVNFYAKSHKARYSGFISAETRKELDELFRWRERWGERLHDDSPVFRKVFSSQQRDSEIKKPEPLSVDSIMWVFNKLLIQTGIRIPKPLLEGQRTSPRTAIMACHGTRKYWEKTAFSAGMNQMYIRKLLGQKGGENNLEEASSFIFS